MEEIAARLKKQLEDTLDPKEFGRWLLPCQIVFNRGYGLTIHVPNIFFKNWIMDRYYSIISRLADQLLGMPVKIDIDCATPGPSRETDAQPLPIPIPFYSNDAEYIHFRTRLIEKFTFANFVVGSCNQLAHAASQAVAYRSATYNPLFIYGSSGLGKTHLLNAIGNHLVGQDRNMRVVYLSSEEFTNELIDALRSEGMSSFRQKYRSIDTLLIDDIQFIGGRERTQEEFFYTFNALYEANKQVVLSSDKMPKDIPDLEERLRSRFEGGLFADISSPDRETKVAILVKKAEEEGITLSNDVAFYLASQQESNIRVLEGYLARLGAYSSLTQNPIDLESAQKLLAMFMEADRKQITLDLILKVTADYYNIKISDLKSSKKQKAIALPRQAAMYLARQLTPYSTIEIGQKLGGRDHSTVIHAVKKIESRLGTDTAFSRQLNELQRLINQNAV